MRIWRYLSVFGLLVSVSGPVLASGAMPLPRLPVDEFPLIPGNTGMRFFEGVWQPLGRNSYGLTKTVTVTDNAISWDDIDDVSPYRVLAERDNYILLISLYLSAPKKAWTDFMIIHLQYSVVATDRRPEQLDMVYWVCGDDDRLKDGERVFRRSRAILLNLFATSYCRKGIGTSKPRRGNSIADIGWSGYSFARITDANKGTGWLRMRRNEKILGVPQGTVPEPKD